MRYSRAGFFTQIRPVRVDDLGTGEKKMIFRKLEPLFEGFRYKYLIKRMLSMRLITKKDQKDPHSTWSCLGPYKGAQA